MLKISDALIASAHAWSSALNDIPMPSTTSKTDHVFVRRKQIIWRHRKYRILGIFLIRRCHVPMVPVYLIWLPSGNSGNAAAEWLASTQIVFIGSQPKENDFGKDCYPQTSHGLTPPRNSVTRRMLRMSRSSFSCKHVSVANVTSASSSLCVYKMRAT